MLKLSESELQKVRGDRIALIAQEPAKGLNPVMPVGEQISEVLRAHRDWNRHTRRQAVDRVLREVRLPEARKVYRAYTHQLSGYSLSIVPRCS